MAYEWRMSLAPVRPPALDAVATQGALVGFYEHLESELDAAGFFHPPEKRPSMVRNLRVALGRARFTDQEVRTLRGVVTALSQGRGKVLEKLAAKKSAIKG
jgi:tRNA/rRNA methyltransferase